MKLWLLPFALLLAWGGPRALASDADAERARARALFLEGKARFRDGKYRRAIEVFVAAGRLRASPLLDYNIARCHEQLGEKALAIQHYRRYLAGRPGAPNRGEVRARLRALRRALRTRPAEPDLYDDLETRVSGAPASAPTSAPASAPAAPSADATSRPAAPGPSSAPSVEREEFPHEATLGGAQPPPRYPPFRAPRTRRVPFYKHWSFWVGVGAAALIAGVIVGIAVSQAADEPARSYSASVRSSGLRFEF